MTKKLFIIALAGLSGTMAFAADPYPGNTGADDGRMIQPKTNNGVFVENRTVNQSLTFGLETDYSTNIIDAQSAAFAVCFKEISVGNFHSVGVKDDGTLWAWGSNQYGQLGDGTSVNRNAPIQIGSANNWVKVVTGFYYTVAIKTDGTLWAWGDNSYGQLGDGTKINKFTPTQIGTATNWKSISAGSNHTVAIKTNGTLWSWGQNNSGQLGDGTTVDKYVPTQIGAASDWGSIGSGNSFTFAIKSNGTLWAWGYNGGGQLGNGTKVSKSDPVQIGTDTNWKSVDGGYMHSVALKTDGTLWAWGDNYNGRLGDGTTMNRISPKQIGTEINWLNISAGQTSTFATKTDGTLWSWGGNSFGLLGNGANMSAYTTTPIQVGSSIDNSQISAGFYHVLVKGTDGVLKVCGLNNYGQLGDGTNNDKNTYNAIGCPSNCLPATQFSATNITSSAASISWAGTTPAPGTGYLYLYSTNSVIGGIEGKTSSTTANLTNLLPGTTYYWWMASNCGSSQGNWVSGGSFTTLPANAAGCWQRVALGNQHSIGIKTDGTLWTWGMNDFGQLGDGTEISKNNPTQIGTGTNWLKIEAGDYFSIGIKTDGTLWAWGRNMDGQLGNGDVANRLAPTQVGTAADWVSIAAGNSHTIALKAMVLFGVGDIIPLDN
ncbi:MULTISPECIES: RCC1 domain-containing protein [unclassified Chryseobacterium]|uniref:RCC1 domain-containing protein n=1 Tax=unclassified Chryseobacterium TaxID=2593645 RepID=UPI00100B8361|nr:MULTISPECIES: RCC1 domain-containing protein [unclassified Chryseobacterium]RXM50598.1 hypothetical protein BOQ64_17810 [Chryseobacterium sp. CH25]RXM63233.1 hypothetical protein BOQ60_18010 [Chryseobacterium sp. CH1]